MNYDAEPPRRAAMSPRRRDTQPHPDIAMYRPDVSDHGSTEAFQKVAARLAGRIIELANTGDDDARADGIREIFATDYTLHSRTGDVMGCDAYIERIAANLRTFSGMHFIMDDLVVQGDRFALRYHWTAPHGDGEIGNEALEINRVVNGQVVETWNYQDLLSLMTKLGVIDNPLAPSA